MSTTPETPGEWFDENPWIYGVIGGVALGLVVLFFVVCCCCCYCYRRRRQDPGRERLVPNEQRRNYRTVGNGNGNRNDSSSNREPSVVEEMNRQRREQESADRTSALTSVEFYVRNTRRNDEVTALPDMGSRMQKYWFKVQSPSGGTETLLTIAPVSQRCPVKLDTATVNAINNLVQALQEHPYLHCVNEVGYLGNKSQLIICQPLMARGSLKDVIYKATPTSDWSQKYSRRSKGLSQEKVSAYGRHILEAMVYLYSKGFPSLGHVQSGNCFVHEGRCLLAGYENTILGYKTRLYRLLKDYIDKIDIIMFGHLVFEMSCGYELTTLTPRDSDYNCVGDGQIREILEFIFQGHNFPSIEAIKAHQFFQKSEAVELNNFRDRGLPSDVRSLLKTVGKGKAVAKQPKKTKTPLPHPNKKKETLQEEPAEDATPKKPTPTPRKK